MVSRYGVAKEGAVGVAVGVGAMHCLLPHCARPHHLSPHPQNPNHNHIHPHNHHPSPSPSPHGHLNQLNHAQHQLTININHHPHQAQQSQHQQAPPQYRIITASARSDFHVPGQSYGAQPGGQVGGGGGSVGVPGGRGPPPLGGIQSIGQSTTGIPPGGPTGGQQAPPQAPTPGVQSQQPQGPAPTTTPPVHTPSPQEMGKQAHLQAQPPPLQQVYVPNQARPASQGYYQAGPRPQQPRGINHRGGQGGGGAQVMGMPGVGGAGGQPTAMYPHPASITVQPGAMYVQSQVPGLHTGPHQQTVYPMNNQMPIQVVFSGPHQRHQTHQSQSFYQPYQPALITQNMFGFAPGPAPQHGYFYPTSSAPINLSRAGAGAVSGGAQHVGGPLAGAQGATVVPQGTLQQPTQQPQPMPTMAIPIAQTEVYSGHNGSATNATNSSTRCRKPRRQKAILDIVDPKTGKNISEEIYEDDTATQSGESSNRETPQPQNCGMEMIADFAARVAKAATEESESGSPALASTPETPTTQNATESLPNLKIQTSPNIDTNSHCNIGGPPTQNISGVPPLLVGSQSLGSSSNVAQLVDLCPIKVESKPLQLTDKEFQPRSEIKTITVEELSVAGVVVNKDNIPAQLPAPVITPVPELEAKSTNSTPSVCQTPSSVPLATVSSSNVFEVPSFTAPSVNPVPAREPFPSLLSKSSSSSSPPRRKSQSQGQSQLGGAAAAAAVAAVAAATVEVTSTRKEQQKERKLSEKSLSSRGATPTPVHGQVEHHHQKINGETVGDRQESEAGSKTESQQKSADGKATQKQKNKNKLKHRDLNRKGAEKEGTDMDAFVNAAQPPVKPEVVSKQQETKESLPIKDSNKDSTKEVTTNDVMEKDNRESKKEKETTPVPQTEKLISPEPSKESSPVPTIVLEKSTTVQQNNREAFKETTSIIEDNSTLQEVCKVPAKMVANDVVDHAKVKEDIMRESAITAQRNEENSKVSALGLPNEEKQTVTPVIDKQSENQPSNKIDTLPKIVQPTLLKYTYKEDQWSPINKSGKKVYDREFLMKLQDDPNSKIKPPNLPDLEVVLKDNSKSRSTVDLRPFKDINLNRHDSLFPGFAKSSLGLRAPPPNRKSHPGKPKVTKPNVIHVSLSLREDVKLRETENAWKPTRLKGTDLSEEEAKTEALYKRVRSVLNKLTPQKFNTLVNQVRSLKIDTRERLQGVINLVFEKAVDEPSYSVAYALMCKELGQMEVENSEKSGKDDNSVNFRKLIVTRCQMEFEKNTVDENTRREKVKELDDCTDPEKKKELQIALEGEERRIRIKSVGNIRFIGELYKLGMLTTSIMNDCIKHLLNQTDEESLECLCKLVTTIGKDLEKKSNLSQYFQTMREIANRKGPGKISSRVRFMLQDVIDLRANKWVPRRDDSNPKTIDQIQKEAESERLDIQLNNTPLNTPRKDDRMDRKRNRGIGPTEEGGWSQPVSRTRQTYSIEAAKLKNKPPSMDTLQLGNRDAYMWTTKLPVGNSKTLTPNKFACLDTSNTDQDKRPLQLTGSRSTGPREYGRTDYKSSYDSRGSRNGSHQLSSGPSSRESSILDSSRSQSTSMPPPQIKSTPQTTVSGSNKSQKSEKSFSQQFTTILEDYLSEANVESAAQEIRQAFDNSTFAKFVLEAVNSVLERSTVARERVSRLMSYLITQNILSLSLFRVGFGEVLELADDLIIDIPKIWTYFAELLSHLVENDAHPLSEMKVTLATLRSQGNAGKLMGALLTKLFRDKGPKWVADKWAQSRIQWSDIVDEERENVANIIKEYNLEFLTGNCIDTESTSNSQLSMDQIHDQLRNLMRENNFDNICSWITANVGNRVKEPQFIRVLMTAILETSIEPRNNTWKLNVDTFQSLQTLIQRYVDANESLELQCLFAIQAYNFKLEHPSGLLLQIIEKLSNENILSYDAFLAWESNKDPAERDGKSVAMVALTSFFISLKEADDETSGEEA